MRRALFQCSRVWRWQQLCERIGGRSGQPALDALLAHADPTRPLSERVAWAASARATTLSMLISGAIRLYFAAGHERLLHRPGDYALWAPGVAHHWRIEQDDTVVLTIRWPSLAGDAADLDEAALAGA